MKSPAPIWGDAGISIPICQSGKLMGFVHQPAAQGRQISIHFRTPAGGLDTG
jgi:hypothetical protein